MFVSSWNYRNWKAVLRIQVENKVGQNDWQVHKLYNLLNHNSCNCGMTCNMQTDDSSFYYKCNVFTTGYAGNVHVKLEFCPSALIHQLERPHPKIGLVAFPWIVASVVCTRNLWRAPRKMRPDLSNLAVVMVKMSNLFAVSNFRAIFPKAFVMNLSPS